MQVDGRVRFPEGTRHRQRLSYKLIQIFDVAWFNSSFHLVLGFPVRFIPVGERMEICYTVRNFLGSGNDINEREKYI